jgi:hypothetical protein
MKVDWTTMNDDMRQGLKEGLSLAGAIEFQLEDPDRLVLAAIIAVCRYEGPAKGDLVRQLCTVLARINHPPMVVKPPA